MGGQDVCIVRHMSMKLVTTGTSIKLPRGDRAPKILESL